MPLSADEPYPQPRGLTGAQRAARRRDVARRSKAKARAAARAAGIVDRETLERSIVDAMREILAIDDRSLSRPIDPRVVLKVAHTRLMERGDREGTDLDRQALMHALGERVTKPVRPCTAGGRVKS
ncbi:hypothetical protein ACRAWG_32570 [Methylobacterium sp. P31]